MNISVAKMNYDFHSNNDFVCDALGLQSTGPLGLEARIPGWKAQATTPPNPLEA